MEAQYATVDAKHIHMKSGVLSKTDRYVPLDRVQDISIDESICHRCFSTASLRIQTAGSGVEGIAEMFDIVA